MIKLRNTNELTGKDLHNLIINALGNAVEDYSNISEKPFILKINRPYFIKFRIYIYNCGNPPGGRPLDEYKIVLNVGQKYGEQGNFDFSGGCFAIIAGYIRQFDVFVLWDVLKHKNFSFNKNLQVKLETIVKALSDPISMQQRKTKNGDETIIVSRSQYLLEALLKRREIFCSDIL